MKYRQIVGVNMVNKSNLGDIHLCNNTGMMSQVLSHNDPDINQ